MLCHSDAVASRVVRARLDEPSEQALASLMVELGGEATRVLVEQLRAVDLDRLDRHAGPEEQRAVDAASERVLAL
jgi:mRNA-degrading endonuclease toxin of MazEF toxin-antitoxin module